MSADAPIGVALVEDDETTRQRLVQALAGTPRIELRLAAADARQILDWLGTNRVDVLLVDTGAGISENVLRFAAFADEIIAVTTPNIAANADCFSIVRILLEMEPNSKIGLLTNMAADCYEAKNVFNKLQAATRKALNYELNDLGYLTNSEQMRVATEQRRPVVFAYPHSEITRNFRDIVDTIFNTRVFVNERKESSFADLMGALKRSMTRSERAVAF